MSWGRGMSEDGDAPVTRSIGGREYSIREDERLIASRPDGWELSELRGWSSEQWVSMRLLDTADGARAEAPTAAAGREKRMRVYQLGFNATNGRMASNVFWSKLCLNYPDVAQWVLMTLEKALRGGET